MNPTDQLERAFEAHCARLYGQHLDDLDEVEMRSAIEQELWDALNFNDICDALATEGAIDEKDFVRAVHECDAQQVLDLLHIAIQEDIEQRAKKEYEKRRREWEWEAQAYEEETWDE
jgi:hypothetical protein